MRTTFGELKVGEKFWIGIVRGKSYKYEKCKEFDWKPEKPVNCFTRNGMRKDYWYVGNNQKVERVED